MKLIFNLIILFAGISVFAQISNVAISDILADISNDMHDIGWIRQDKATESLTDSNLILQKKLKSSSTLWTLYLFKRKQDSMEQRLTPDFFKQESIDLIQYTDTFHSVVSYRIFSSNLGLVNRIEVISHSRVGEIDFILSSSSKDLVKMTKEQIYTEINQVIPVIFKRIRF